MNVAQGKEVLMDSNCFHILLVDDILIRGDFETSWRRNPVESELGKHALDLCMRFQDWHPEDKQPLQAMVDGFEAGVQHTGHCVGKESATYVWANGSLNSLAKVNDDDLLQLAEAVRRETTRRRESKRELEREAKRRRKNGTTDEIPF
ncbi:MAG: hypothetical protein HC853_00325 [Anaerolineae bacterium]|nr:hypothetical protein [Anaerolineae bacterium]